MNRRDYVVAELHGRLGNQLFQFASSYGIARRRDARLLFSSSEVAREDLLLPELIGDRYVEATPRELLGVGRFAYPIRPSRVCASAAYHSHRWVRRARHRTPPSVQYWHATGMFRPEVFELDLPVYLQGHLQSERYFADYATEIVAALDWPQTASQLPDSARPAVAVSFRRGDYNSLGWALPLGYYDRALTLVAERIPGATYALFGDDRAFLDLVADRIARFGPVVNALTLGQGPIAQLHLMTQCDHCVLSNSSFAWWGAWLGDQRSDATTRAVVAPAEYGVPDRIPKRWEVIEAGIPPT